jgi:hypothetical protein
MHTMRSTQRVAAKDGALLIEFAAGAHRAPCLCLQTAIAFDSLF